MTLASTALTLDAQHAVTRAPLKRAPQVFDAWEVR